MGEGQSKNFFICSDLKNIHRNRKNKKKSPDDSDSINENVIEEKEQTQTFSFENDFKLIKRIQSGSYGEIIQCRFKTEEKILAIKKIKLAKKTNKQNNEISILQNISHPFIINYHFSFKDEKNLYIVLDYHKNGDLNSLIKKKGFLKEKEAKFYLTEIYIAIKYLHNNGIIHRDIKSENILLDSNGHIKLIDFGLAKNGLSNGKLTSSFCGTAECLPPEVILHEDYSTSFDFWSFGILMYEMLYGYPPFRDISRGGIFNQIINEDINYYSENNISSDAISLLQGLLNKDKKKRINPRDIPKHPFFKGISFRVEDMMKECSPFLDEQLLL